MAREAKTSTHARAWWTDYEAVLPSKFQTYVELEAAAGSLLMFTLTLIDGLLQTRGYARALYEAWNVTELPAGVEPSVDLRLRRQAILHADPAVELTTVMDETALRRPIGSPATMRAQLDHVAAVAGDIPNVTIQVIPWSAGPHDTLSGDFTIIEPRDPRD